MRLRFVVLALVLPVAAVLLLGATAEYDGTEGRMFFGMWRTRHVLVALVLLGLAGGFGLAAVSRRAGLRYGLVVVQLSAAILLLEAVGWLGIVSYAELMGNTRYLPTNALAVSPAPNVEVCGETYQDVAHMWGVDHDPIPFCYRTNRHGFRNPPELDDADVYLLGDSIVVSALVPSDETIAARLTTAWGRPVMNVALISISPQEEHEIFRESKLPVEGRLVLQFLFEGNDLIDSAHYHHSKQLEAAEDDSPTKRSFVRNSVLALQRLTQPTVAQAVHRSCEIGGVRHFFQWISDAWEGLDADPGRIFEAVEAFAAEVRAGGGAFAVIYVPSKLRVLGPECESWPPGSPLPDFIDANPFRAKLHAWAAESDVPVLDVTDPLRESARDGRLPWPWGDTHWNTTAQEVVAGVILEATREGSLPLP